MSRFIYFAKLAVKSEFVTRKLFDFYTQLIVFAPSTHAIKQSRSLANTLGRERMGLDSSSVESVFESLALLRCFELPDSEFIRVGPNYDGGYVVHKNISQINKIISIGVAEDTSFEEDFYMKNKNINFYLFDHTVTPKRKLPANFRFFSLGLGKHNENSFINLDYIIDTYLKLDDLALLKIDIEGSEYEALEETGVDTLSRFDQILIELHDLSEEKITSKFFKSLLLKLRKGYYLVHVHGNNNDGYTLIKGACIPKTLELTFVNKKFKLVESVGTAIFPRDLDFPNTTGDDLSIGSFRFKTY
jgi:FkbM family methyltransferase